MDHPDSLSLHPILSLSQSVNFSQLLLFIVPKQQPNNIIYDIYILSKWPEKKNKKSSQSR